jgi:predicted nucleic acid-binding protein
MRRNENDEMVVQLAGYLLDTNVISELMKARPAASVADWIASTLARRSLGV